jgi:hypothetical protein
VVYLYLGGLWQEIGGANGKGPALEDGTESSETSAIRTQTKGDYPKESIIHTNNFLLVFHRPITLRVTHYLT